MVKRRYFMKRFRKLAAVVSALMIATAAAMPTSAAPAQTETYSVECELLAGTSISKMKFGKIDPQPYTGKTVKPGVTVKNGSTTLVEGKDYTLSYKNNVKIGTATVTVKGKGKYSGSKKLTFKIIPGTTTLKVSQSGKKISLSWGKVSGATTYQLYYSVNGGKFKLLTATNKTSFSTSKLSTKNKYTFKVRALSKKNGKTSYGGWSKTVSPGSSASYTPTLDNPNLKVNKRIKWMSWYEIDETTPQAQLFKETYGVPATGDDPYRDGRIFDFINVAYPERYDKLATAISAGDSPDLFPFDISDYPYGVLKGRYQPLDSIIDFSSPKWDNSRDIMDQIKLDGKNYCAVYEISFKSLMYYRKSVIKEAGLSDPRKLFEQGKWTWDAFLDMARKFQKSGDNKYVMEGYNSDSNLLVTTGTPIISLENGKLVNNMQSDNVKRAMDFLSTLQSENLRYPLHEMGWSLNKKLWAQGNVLFYADGGSWEYEGDSGLWKFAERFDWADDEICVVPYPKDPQSDKYYQNMYFEAYMWCKGSTNKNGVAAWIDCGVTTALDPKTTAGTKELLKDRYNWTDYNLDFIYSQTSLDGSSMLTPVFEFKNGIGTDIANAGDLDSPVMALTTKVALTGDMTYDQVCNEYFAVIDARVKEINKKL